MSNDARDLARRGVYQQHFETGFVIPDGTARAAEFGDQQQALRTVFFHELFPCGIFTGVDIVILCAARLLVSIQLVEEVRYFPVRAGDHVPAERLPKFPGPRLDLGVAGIERSPHGLARVRPQREQRRARGIAFGEMVRAKLRDPLGGGLFSSVCRVIRVNRGGRDRGAIYRRPDCKEHWQTKPGGNDHGRLTGSPGWGLTEGNFEKGTSARRLYTLG